ncbi:hypothetical protein D3C75_610780 [compost metagenome]
MGLITAGLHRLPRIVHVSEDRAIRMDILIKAHRALKNPRIVTQHTDRHHTDNSSRVPVAVSQHRNRRILEDRIDHIQHHSLQRRKVLITIPAVTAAVIPDNLRSTRILVGIDARSQNSVPAVNHLKRFCPLIQQACGHFRILVVSRNDPL